jgi:hypothetical protein
MLPYTLSLTVLVVLWLIILNDTSYVSSILSGGCSTSISDYIGRQYVLCIHPSQILYLSPHVTSDCREHDDYSHLSNRLSQNSDLALPRDCLRPQFWSHRVRSVSRLQSVSDYIPEHLPLMHCLPLHFQSSVVTRSAARPLFGDVSPVSLDCNPPFHCAVQLGRSQCVPFPVMHSTALLDPTFLSDQHCQAFFELVALQAFGYFATAPPGSITMNTRSYHALCLSQILVGFGRLSSSATDLISSPFGLHSAVVPTLISEDCFCVSFVSAGDVFVVDIIQRTISRFLTERFVQQFSFIILRFFLRCCILTIDLNVYPIVSIRRIRLLLMRPFFLKHDFHCYMDSYHLRVCPRISCTIFFAVGDLYTTVCCNWLYNYVSTFMLPHALCDMACNEQFNSLPNYNKKHVGGARIRRELMESDLEPYLVEWSRQRAPQTGAKMKFVGYMVEAHAQAHFAAHKQVTVYECPVPFLLLHLTVPNLRTIAGNHNIFVGATWTMAQSLDAFHGHVCTHCPKYLSVFEVKTPSQTRRQRVDKCRKKKSSTQKADARKKDTEARRVKRAQGLNKFPPEPLSKNLTHTIASGFCKAMAPSRFVESGCAVCGRLTIKSELIKLSEIEWDLGLLARDGEGVTRLERFAEVDSIQEIKGPILDPKCDSVCKGCDHILLTGHVPIMALANDLWIGDVPEQLQGLSYAEKLLVARVRHNRCVVKVSSSGMHKMKANAITFANPMPKIYHVLPPPQEELDDVLAFIFTGPCRPTEDDLKRTPLLVRRNKVAHALEWLKLNHVAYKDLEISYDNLNAYPENGPPVVIDYRHSSGEKDPEATAVHDNEQEDGASSGDCPFVVHGLTGEELGTKSLKTLIAIAMDHMTKNRKIVAIGHEEKPQSIYNNPLLYPQMFPWLFPYGVGGIGNAFHKGDISSLTHKGHLLMYHDKRFQRDPHFPLIAFNHEQIKAGTTGGYLLTKKQSFPIVADRLLNLDLDVLSDIAKRLSDGERVKPVSDAEKACFQVINDLDHIGHHVEGSITNKRYMRNEIWSLISYKGAPSWFITFSPADVKHPICLYFADTKEQFSPDLRAPDECYRLIANNPVAGARFFNFMVEAFIEHVLGVKQPHRGLYGDTSAYYGTVEQQGRLTLHLHLLLWIRGALTPQEIRDKIMDPTSDFQKKIVEYLESVHQGEFIKGSLEDIRTGIDDAESTTGYQPPTHILPECPPPKCQQNQCTGCFLCLCFGVWWHKFKCTADDLLWRSNIHECGARCYSDGRDSCKSRFPRDLYEETEVDPDTGALNMKHGEAHLNTFTPLLTYLLRCNSDVTSLLSGTAVKAVVAYVTEYVTKPGLKTHSVFDTIRTVFDRNSELIGGGQKRQEKARRVLTQIVNALTAKIEIGGPMAAMYLLKHPDHYTNQQFKIFYWKSYVREVRSAWSEVPQVELEDGEQLQPENVVVDKEGDVYVGLSDIDDYKYRPKIYENTNLYTWIRLAKKTRKPKNHISRTGDEEDDDNDDKLETDSEVDNDSDLSTAENMDNRGLQTGDRPTRSRKLGKAMIDSLEYESRRVSAYKRGVSWAADTDSDVKGKKVPLQSDLHSFTPEHQQCETHQVNLEKDDEQIVPNFVGGVLPRSDCGDREYYCSTILTFFKPWRSGKDLKSKMQTWDDAYTENKFTEREAEIIKYFNLRYECLDARDDYSARRKRGEKMTIFSQWSSDDVLNDLDNDLNQNGGDFEYDEHQLGNELDSIGEEGHKIIQHMMEIENVVRDAGWLAASLDGIPTVDHDPVIPDITLSASQWDASVQAEKQKILEQRQKTIPKFPTNGNAKTTDPFQNNAKVVNRRYLEKAFKIKNRSTRIKLAKIVEKFRLNTEQERAFRIVANHASEPGSERLSMYLGGMAGTGKSQVIKALVAFFNERNESHRFMLLAPTGSAAALIDGSTYHSVLGINERTDAANAKNIAKVRTKIDGVEYIFLDEVSMLSCHDMFQISAQLARATNEHDEPFGGINMVFAGDFAQLPPVKGGALYSRNIGAQLTARMSMKAQEETIGKALWHQVTTVVILRENMRQTSQSADDEKLRTALENMRYKACTPDDIKFLRTRIAGPAPDRPKLAQKKFRNVSIITAWNAHKDRINQLGIERFAAETGQSLVTFYSKDQWKADDGNMQKRRWTKRKVVNPIRKSNALDPALQRALWDLPHASTDHVPGKLSICMGMPVMLRNNSATECCMTKGAEGVVAGWQAIEGPSGKPILDTIFIRLTNPPKKVKINGLPENVVPITRTSTKISCKLWNDEIISVNRNQVLILPNFSMTDYASQGRTRPQNLVDLNNCKSHMSYYTCLSRSATAEGTVIIQGFDPSKITGNAPGYLRQEFRELEILDDISKLRYAGTLPDCVNGHRRNSLIEQFRKWKGLHYMPDNMHPAIQWSATSNFELQPDNSTVSWHIPKRNTTKGKKNQEEGTVPLHSNEAVKKRPLDIDEVLPYKKQKKVVNSEDISGNASMSTCKRKAESETYLPSKKTRLIGSSPSDSAPVGLMWDGINYSCAYDALLTVIHSIWQQDPIKWSDRLSEVSPNMKLLTDGFNAMEETHITFERLRNNIRRKLHNADSNSFPYGTQGTSLPDLAQSIFKNPEINASSYTLCSNCEWTTDTVDINMSAYMCKVNQPPRAVTDQLRDAFVEKLTPTCPECDGQLFTISKFKKLPKILAISIETTNIKINMSLKIAAKSKDRKYFLKGIIYLGGFHFTARIITNDKSVWFHDGQTSGRHCHYDKPLNQFEPGDLNVCGDKHVVMALYARK